MKIRFSISLKLLLFILPLLCIPIALVGYLSSRASVERVNRLVRHEQMVKVKARAGEINDIFYYCRMDLDTISRLPVIEDYFTARSFRLAAEAEFNYDNIVRLFKHFLARTPYYYQIRYIDNLGEERIRVRAGSAKEEKTTFLDAPFFKDARQKGINGSSISPITYSPSRKGYVIHWARSISSGWKEFAGVVVIDLDYEKILQMVKKIHVGERGYAFLVDHQGRNIAHPRFKPYHFDLHNYPDKSLNNLVLQMMTGGSRWKEYTFNGDEKVAAFAPIPTMGWSLAVTIPIDEFRREAQAIQTRVIQVVAITLIFAVIGVSVLSYYLLRPVRNLVVATHHVANGDLNQEIPIQSRDELGDLTRSFNRMIKNLSLIQNELVRSEKLISLGRLSAGVAHEIRNPLNAMKGAIVYLQRRRPEDSVIQEYTELVSEEIDRLNTFVSEFLYFARQSLPKKVPTDFNRLILSVQDLFSKQALEKNIHFENHLDPLLPPLPVDPHQMEQVLVNLLINAMDAMDSGGVLSFSTGFVGGEPLPGYQKFVRFTVEDQGTGISKDHLKSVFDPFFSTKETGTGLGLPLSLGIVESHGGSIAIKSEEGKGTVVLVDLAVEFRTGAKEELFEEEKDTGS
jgi:signal transduction histidine kinase